MRAVRKEDSYRDFVLDHERPYFKTDESTRLEYRDRGMGPFAPGGEVVLKSYYEVPEDIEAETENGACRYILLPDESWSAPDDEADYSSLAGEGFDSILEIGIVSVGFKGTQWGSDPSLSVFLAVRVRRYDGKNGNLLGVENLVFEGGERKFAEWMTDGAARPIILRSQIVTSRLRTLLRLIET